MDDRDKKILETKIDFLEMDIRTIRKNMDSSHYFGQLDNISSDRLILIVLLMFSCARTFFLSNAIGYEFVPPMVQFSIRMCVIVWLLYDIYDFRKEANRLSEARKIVVGCIRRTYGYEDNNK